MQPENMKLPGIEYARGIAAILVVFYHVARHMRLNIGYLPLGGVAQFGHAGVDFFFVLSGFIIFYVHNKDIGNLGRLPYYAQRRFIRIFPLHWTVFSSSLILAALFSDQDLPELSVIFQSFLLLPSVADRYIGVAWSLQQEIIFYAIFSLSIAHTKLGFFTLFVWLVLITLNCFSFFPEHTNIIASKFLLDYNIEFFFGILAAWLSVNNIITSKRLFLILGSTLFLTTGITENLGLINGYTSSARIAYGLSSFLMVLGFVGMKDIKGQIGAILNSLGSASYSIYLTHFISIGVIYKILEITGLFDQLSVWLNYFILSAAGIIGGILVSNFVEYPLMRFVKTHFFSMRLIGLKKR